MRLTKAIFATTMALAAVASAQTRYFGGIDVGSKGTKAALFSVSQKAEESQIKPIFGKTINTRLVSTMQNGRFTAAGMEDAAEAAKDLLETMRAEAKSRRLQNIDYYIVGSSGVALAKNTDDLKKAISDKTGIEMDFIDAGHEGYFGLTSAVPARRRATSMYIDIGSGNTKLGCLVNGGTFKSFRPDEIKYGSVSGRNKARDLNPGDIAAGVRQLMQAEVGPSYGKDSMDIPCLSNRQRIYWTGGAAWATATMMHPEKALDSYVVIGGREIDAFLARLEDKSWIQRKPDYVFPKDTAPATASKIRAQGEKEREDVMNTFSREDLLSGVSIMKTVLGVSNPSAVVVFARESGFIYGCGLERMANQAISESRPQPLPDARPQR